MLMLPFDNYFYPMLTNCLLQRLFLPNERLLNLFIMTLCFGRSEIIVLIVT